MNILFYCTKFIDDKKSNILHTYITMKLSSIVYCKITFKYIFLSLCM